MKDFVLPDFMKKKRLTQKFQIHIQICKPHTYRPVDLLSRDTESFLPKVNASFPNPRPAGAEQDLPHPAKPNLVPLAFEHRYRVAHRYTGLRLRFM